jgi:hypothetical protein
VDVGLIPPFFGRKNFSHRRSKFPSTSLPFRLAIEQWLRELEAEQVVTIHVGYPDGASPQDSGGLREGVSGNQGGTRDFKQKLRRERQGAANGDERSARGNVERGGEFQELFSIFVQAADKDRNRQRQTGPLPVFRFRPSSLQPNPSRVDLTDSLPHLGGQTKSRIWTPPRAQPLESTPFLENPPTKAELTHPIICHSFALLTAFPGGSEYLGLQAFSLP